MIRLTWDDGERPDAEEMAALEQGARCSRSDLGNGARFLFYAELVKPTSEIAFDPATGTWLFRYARGSLWVVDVGGLHVRRVAHQVLAWIEDEVRLLSESGAPAAEVEAHCRHVEASGNSERIDAMLREAAPHLVRKD